MSNVQVKLQHDRSEASFVAELKAKTPQEPRFFMADPWTASNFSAEEIAQLLVELHETETCPLDWVAEGVAEMGQDWERTEKQVRYNLRAPCSAAL